jgi:hypothetical protein
MKGKYFIGVLLCVLMLLVPFANVVEASPEDPAVYIVSKTETIESFGSNYTFSEFYRIEEWANGTKKVFASVMCSDIPQTDQDFRVDKVVVNMTKTIYPDNTEEPVILNSPMPTDYWDNVLFLLAPGNGSYTIKYHHPDNYFTYYPMDWARHWNMKGTEKNHIHLGMGEVQAWIDGSIDTPGIVAKIFEGLGLGVCLIGSIAAYFLCPWAAVPGIIGSIAAIIAFIVRETAPTLQEWIKQVVRAENGDGWCWNWGLHTVSTESWIFSGPLQDPERTTMPKKYTIGLGIHAIKEFQQSWGEDRDNPGTTTIEWWTSEWIHFGMGVEPV